MEKQNKMKPDLEWLEQEEKELLERLDKNKKEQENLNLEMFLKEKGIAIGSTVEFLSRKKPVRGKLVSADFIKKKVSKLVLEGDNRKELVIWESGFHTIKPVK